MKKQEVRDLLGKLSEDFDPEQLIDDLYVKAKLEHAEAAVAAGDVLSHEDAVRQIQQWFQ
jgi:hypothetical protein